MSINTARFLIVAMIIAMNGTVSTLARDRLQIVGSSTLFPFATSVAETFGKTTPFKTPIVEATGSGGGMKLFCSGVGYNTPDIANASRRIKTRELEKCNENGVTPVEVKVGFDGIVLANSINGTQLHLTLAHIYLALAKYVPGPGGELIPNPNKKWSHIDLSLPSVKIEVLGPPPTSGTRDAFEELAMGGGAISFPLLKELKSLKIGDPRILQIASVLSIDAPASSSGKHLFKRLAYEVREDGAYIEAGENDNLIIQKLKNNSNAMGIFGFSFLDQNSDKVQGAAIEGVAPEFDEIAAGNYRISRSLYFYIKKEHVGVLPGIEEYLLEFTKEGTWGDEGYLSEKGLIPLPKTEREKFLSDLRSMTPLSM